jgi:hypothetical protein
MSGEVKYDTSHHAGSTPAARIANRLKNSGDTEHAHHVVQTGNSPNRVFTNIHHSRQHKYGEDAKGVGIDGKLRGPANPVKRGDV